MKDKTEANRLRRQVTDAASTAMSYIDILATTIEAAVRADDYAYASEINNHVHADYPFEHGIRIVQKQMEEWTDTLIKNQHTDISDRYRLRECYDIAHKIQTVCYEEKIRHNMNIEMYGINIRIYRHEVGDKNMFIKVSNYDGSINILINSYDYDESTGHKSDDDEIDFITLQNISEVRKMILMYTGKV